MSDIGKIYIYNGNGHGKSGLAIGHGVKAATKGKKVVIIQFLKGRDLGSFEILKKLEPEIKMFSFEKSETPFDDLTEEQKKEECVNIRNGFNFSHKVLTTGECDMLILDEFLGLVDSGILTIDDLKLLVAAKPESTDLVLTGINVSKEVLAIADHVTTLTSPS